MSDQEKKDKFIKKMEEKKDTKRNMRNITINLPDLYDKNLLKLQKLGMIPSRSEGVRLAIRNFLQQEYKNLKLLGYFEE
jgi:hypothetical protein